MFRYDTTYKDYNGVERTESFLFHFSEAEALEMELSKEGGLSEHLHKIIKAKDQPSLVKEFKEIVLKAYGEKSEDGKRFIKSKELSDAFSQTVVYSELFMKLASDDEFAAKFVNKVIPQKGTSTMQELPEPKQERKKLG